MITALGLTIAGAGALLLWSGIVNEKVSDVLLELATGESRRPGIVGGSLGSAKDLVRPPAGGGAQTRPVVQVN